MYRETVAESFELAPNFHLRDVDGDEVALSDFAGDKNVVLVFNRGFL